MPLRTEIDDYIASLPVEYQAVAAQLREYLKTATTSQIQSVFACLFLGNVIDAYHLIVPNLSAEETAAEIDGVASALADLNQANAEQIAQLQTIIRTILALIVQTAASLI